ncbi:tyrosine-specific transport protein [Rosa sericea]
MDSNCITSSTSLHTRSHFNPKTNHSWGRLLHQNSTSNFRIYHACSYSQQLQQQQTSSFTRNGFVKKAKTGVIRLSLDVKPIKDPSKKKGTIAGAVALIIGTSIGSGILALPEKASPAGFIPSSISMVICWGFLLIEALLLIEINVSMRRRKGKDDKENELEIISIRTMAQETLGDWGGTLASLVYIFLGYTSVIAYSSKSGEILFHLINLPAPVSGIFFTSVFTLLISIGGTQATDQVNQLLTASMIGLLVAIEVLAVVFGGWSGLQGSGDWGKVPATIPVIIFSLVYHDLAPVLCAYLGSDLKRLRISVVLGSLVPLLGLLVWDGIALGLSAQADPMVDPVELLMRVKWSGISYMVEAFSLLAVGTSLIGTLLGFSEFFKEQLNSLLSNSSLTQTLQKPNMPFDLRKWWAGNKVSFTSVALVVVPSLFVSTTVPDAFSTATDVAGGYCMTMLYGVLPPAMAWAMHNKERDNASDQKTLSRARPVLVVVGLLACGIVAEQILQDILIFHF